MCRVPLHIPYLYFVTLIVTILNCLNVYDDHIKYRDRHPSICICACVCDVRVCIKMQAQGHPLILFYFIHTIFYYYIVIICSRTR